MELTDYLNCESANHCGSGEFSESRMFCLDQGNSLAHSGKLMTFGDDCSVDEKTDLSDLIKMETHPDDDLPQIDVNSHESEKYLVKSIEAASIISNMALLKLNANRESIKLLRRSLKEVERQLKTTKIRKSYDRKAKSKHFTESIEEFADDEIDQDYRVSADETESETELIEKNRRKRKKVEKKVYRKDLYDQYDPKFAKRFPVILKWSKNFWFYNGIFIQNGQLVKSPLPSYLSKNDVSRIRRRVNALSQLDPDPRIFAHVQNEVSWPESDFEPLLVPFLSETVQRRVLKGMSQGKLYNIDYRQLSLIFMPRIMADKHRCAKCPLCENEYIGKDNVLRHIEIVHSNFACFCGLCGQVYLQKAQCIKHECSNINRRK